MSLQTKSRSQVLAGIEAGDVIFGIAAGGQEKLLFVYRTSPDKIFARHVTSQSKAEFDREGKSTYCEGGGSCEIISAAPLPPDRYNVVVGLDRKTRLMHSLEQLRLTDTEARLLLEIDDFYRAWPLPEG